MRVSVNGVELYFDVDGAGLRPEGGVLRAVPAVIALHGGPGFDHGYLKPALAGLREASQLIYLDLRGQGRSSAVAPAACTLAAMAEDVAAFCSAVGLERPVLLGHSVGGYVALTLALDYPEAVSKVVLINSAARMDLAAALDRLERRQGAEARDAAARLFAGDVSDETLEAFSKHALPAYTHPSTAAALVDLALSGLNAEIAGHFFRHELPGYDLRGRLAELSVPLLALTGGDDWLSPPEEAHALARTVPAGRAEILAETGHFAANERSDAVLRAVRDFLAEVAAG